MLSLSYYAIDIDMMAIKTLFQFLKQEKNQNQDLIILSYFWNLLLLKCAFSVF